MLSISLLVFITRICFVYSLEGTGSIEICTTPGCVKAATNILDSMDRSKDPCDNFFEYACGQWKKDNPIPDDRTYYDTMYKVTETVTKQIKSLLERNKTESAKSIDMVKTIYRRCMDTETLNTIKSQPLISAIQELGNWPLLDPNWTDDKLDMTNFLAQIYRSYVDSVFFSVVVAKDYKNVTNSILTIDKGFLGLGSRSLYMNDSLYKKQMGAYKKFMLASIRFLTTDLNIEMTPQMEADVDRILDFEHQLANITVSIRDLTTRYNKWTIKSLIETVPFIDWLAYFEIIMPSKVFDRISDPNFFFFVFEPEYMLNLQSLLKQTDKKVLVNYGIWRLVKNWSIRLDVRYYDIVQDFYKTMYGTVATPYRSESCVSTAISALNLAVGALYIEERFNENDKIEALSMVQNLQKSYKDIINDLDWMDEATKRIALEKVDAMLIEIGYPDYILDSSALDLHYSELIFNDADSYFDLIKKVYSWIVIQNRSWLLKPFDRRNFVDNPTDVKCIYSFQRNSITLPAGILRAPLFESDFPKAVNYGGIGSIVGNKITHGIDIAGRQYDKFGNDADWWSTSSKKKFEQKMKCLIDQYGNFTVPEINANINGRLTLTENLGDNGGIKDSFKAYETYLKSIGGEEPRLPGLQELTNEQIFFLSFANVYCSQSTSEDALSKLLTDNSSPNMFRVIGSLINLPEFSSAFNCPKNSYMNSKFPRCSVW